MKRSPLNVLHLAPVLSILKIIEEELHIAWGNEVNIMSFTDAVLAARQVLFVPDIPVDLAIVDSDIDKAEDFIAALQDIYPDCPIVLTAYEQNSVDPALLSPERVKILTKPFTVRQLIETAEGCPNCSPTL